MKNYSLLINIIGVCLLFFITSCKDDEVEAEVMKELHVSLKGSNYHLLLLDNISAEKIKDKIVRDYRPDNILRHVYIWADSYTTNLCTEQNFYGELQGWRAYSVGTQGWSAVALHSLQEAGGVDMITIDETYTFHMVIKSKDEASHAIKFLGSDGALYGFAIGTEGLEGVEPYTDYERDGEWHEIEVPVKDLFEMGLNYDAVIETGDMAIFYSGGITGSTLDVDAVFFYKK